MELLEKQIQTFLSIGVGSGGGKGYGRIIGSGIGDGSGSGTGYGRIIGSGIGYGYGDGNGIGFVNRFGNGNGDGCGEGYGLGSGNGYGGGDGYGDGNGDGFGYGIAEIEGHKVYDVDNTPTIITAVHGNVAQGYLLLHNTRLIPCYIVKEANKFAHGATLREAYTALLKKLYDGSTKEERIAAFVTKFPDYDTPYDNADLFTYHHVLTGSCRMGRENFVKNHGLSLDGQTTVRQFVALTEDSYGGKVIRQLEEAYKVKEAEE